MRAIVIHEAKDLRIEERPEDTPGPGQVAIRLAAGGVCGSDLHYYNHGGFGAVRLKEPMILGHEVAGHIASVGPGVEGLKEGDLVLVVDDQQPRSTWRLARVIEAVPEVDEHVRKATVKTADKKTLLRDRESLVLLEMDSEQDFDAFWWTFINL